MTPREQIQEHARVAAAKISEAMAEFHGATGLQAQAQVRWGDVHFIDAKDAKYAIEGVAIRYGDEVVE